MKFATPILATLCAVPAAHATQRGVTNFIVDIALDSVESWDAQGSSNNTILTLDIGDDSVTSVGWDLTIDTVGESWRSEASFRFTDVEGNHFFTLTPGVNDDSPGTTHYASGFLVDLTDNGISNFQPAGGLLLIEIFESYDDVAGAVDAYIDGELMIGLDGTLTPPAPGAAALFAVVGFTLPLRRRASGAASRCQAQQAVHPATRTTTR